MELHPHATRTVLATLLIDTSAQETLHLTFLDTRGNSLQVANYLGK